MRIILKHIVAPIILITVNFVAIAQPKLTNQIITVKFDNVTLVEAIKIIEAQTGISFAYNKNIFDLSKKHSINAADQPVEEVLKKLLEPHNLSFKEMGGKIILFKPSSKKVTISGYITDKNTGEKLINANVFDRSTLIGTISNTYGFYSLTLPAETVELSFSYVGYKPVNTALYLKNDTALNVFLDLKGDLEEVKVVAQTKNTELKSTQMSRIDMSMDKIQNLPVMFGEVDVIKAIQLMPGVQSGTEGSSGLYVRGGGPDQNLILLDGVPVYNVSHLFGFFSVFNPNAIKNVSLYKGGFPARFGGRLSSVLDIRMKEGNEKELHGQFNVGIISSNFNLEGPIIKDKTAFNISARRTYIDLLAKPLMKNISKGDETVGYYFYDLNAKVNHKFSDKSRLYLSAYTGSDKGYGNYKDKYDKDFGSIEFNNGFGLNWRNIVSALRWNYIFSNKLFSNTTMTYSNYQFNIDEEYEKLGPMPGAREYFKFKYFSGIEDLSAKIDFDYFPNPQHDVKFGMNYTNHLFKPGITTLKEEQGTEKVIDNKQGDSDISSHEYYLYVEDNFDIGSKLKANVGAHYSGISVQGELFQSVQPRISLRYLVSPNLSFKAAYTKMSQYIHLLSSSTISLPTDLWLPVTKKTKPQNSNQYAVGTYLNILNTFDFSVEGYYKETDNLIEYKEGASFQGSVNWEDKIETGGKGWSYGMEFLLEKTAGKTSGWIGYTLAWADRKFENLNFGKVYPARYDRRNDVSIALTHKFNDRIDIGATWVYGTGNAVTFSSENYKAAPVLPEQGLNFNQDIYSEKLGYYGGRNNYRMPSYHRFDVGINFHKKKKHGVRTWNVSVYNAYNRKNPFFIYTSGSYDEKTMQTNTRIKQISLFPVIPSVSYSYKF